MMAIVGRGMTHDRLTKYFRVDIQPDLAFVPPGSL